MKFTFFKRKPDPRIAELETRALQWEDNAHRYRRERDDWNQKYIVLREDANELIALRDNLLQQLENHKAATLSWVWDQFSDGSGDWITLEQDDNYCIDPDSVNHKFLAYSPVTGKSLADSCKKFDTQLEAKKYLETLYLKTLSLKSHD